MYLRLFLVSLSLILFFFSSSPCRELAMQSHQVVVDVGGLKSVCIYGGVPKPQQKSDLRAGAEVRHGLLHCVLSYDRPVYHIIPPTPLTFSSSASSPYLVKSQQNTSYHIISFHIILYHIILCHIVSYYIISYHIRSFHIISYHIISHHLIPYRIISYHVMS